MDEYTMGYNQAVADFEKDAAKKLKPGLVTQIGRLMANKKLPKAGEKGYKAVLRGARKVGYKTLGVGATALGLGALGTGAVRGKKEDW